MRRVPCIPLVLVALSADSGTFGQEKPPVTLKPGFEFVLERFPSLEGYKVLTDEVETAFLATSRLARQLYLARGEERLRLRIGVARSLDDAHRFLTEFRANTQADAERTILPGASLGLKLGDESLVRRGSTADQLKFQVALRLKNVFVSIEQRHIGAPVNLRPIAVEIDSALRKLPDVVPGKSDGRLPSLGEFEPSISEFSPGSVELRPGDFTDLTVDATDPQGRQLKRIYLKPDGYVFRGAPGSPDRYKAGSRVGDQKLTLIVLNDSLLFDTQAIEFSVSEG